MGIHCFPQVNFPDLKTTTSAPQHPATEDSASQDSGSSSVCDSCPPCKDCPPCPQCTSDVFDRACPEPVLCPMCHCDPPKECLCEQAALPLLRKYIKTVLSHLGDQVKLIFHNSNFKRDVMRMFFNLLWPISIFL